MGAPVEPPRKKRGASRSLPAAGTLVDAKQPDAQPPIVGGLAAEVPEFMRYDFVLTGYRYNHTAWRGVAGLFELHFETVNIWTHLLGLLWFVAQFPRLGALLEATNAAPIDRFYYYAFLGCAIFQMGTSTAYHMWRSMGAAWETALLRLDVLGVTGMIIGSYAVGLLNGFWCDPWLHVTYMCVIVAILGAGCGLMLIESFQDPRWMLARNLVLALSVAFGLVPSLHWALVETCTAACLETFAWALVQMFGFYGLGFLLFIYRIPERWAPGWFDLVGASHQWWHVAVYLAGSAWFEGMLRYYQWRTTSLVCPSGMAGDSHAYDKQGGWWPHPLHGWLDRQLHLLPDNATAAGEL